ncbi:MocR-like transcription factor YczR [Cellulomonas composti]|uniref:Putative GntR-family regulatory protein n=1 Tax=Cellulomonas composti TaxID=266130 RepID=A0A511J805_9CELL|nr:PLP-dependent aminotransferase family protein [Cellulomonas composti]GEL93833.1 putative GntR-family regulatory protein [Cellulomonas composti]
MIELPSERRVSGHRLATLLGAWHRPGPAYTALADALRAAVLSGTVPLRSRVPSERELADALGVSRTTTTAAYDALRDEGYLVSRRGSGTVTTVPEHHATVAPSGTSVLPDDEAVVDLSIAAPDAPTALHGAVVAALDALPRHLASTGYSPTGLPELRRAIAERYTARGVPTTPEQILVTTGGQQAIHLLVAAHAGPGDRVLVEQPTYPHALDAVRAAGARPVPVPSGRDGLDLDLFESTLRQTAPRLAYLIPDHRNPNGTSLDAAAREQVRALARRHRTLVVGDEALTDLTLEGAAPPPFAGDGSAAGLVVCVGSASKSFWGGLRVGWLRAHPDVVVRLAAARAHVDIGTSVLDQLVVVELLADEEAVLTERRRVLRARRDLLHALVSERLPAWDVPVPPGGLALWADLGAPVSSALAAIALRHGVRVAPGPTFGTDASLERFVRLPYTSTPDRLERAVDGLGRAWSALGLDTGAASPLDAERLVV